MTWQPNPYAIPLFIGAFPLVAIAGAAWRRRSNLAARLFFGFTLSALGLVLTYGLELLSADLDSMMVWLRFEYFFHWGVVFWPLFALAYSGHEAWITRRRVLALFIVPTIILALVWTNQAHGLIWRTTAARMIGSVALFDRTYGIALWVWMAYLSTLFLVGHVILIRDALHTRSGHRAQVVWLGLALLLPAVGATMTVTGLTPIPLLDPTPYSIALSCFPLAVSVFRYHLFDLVPAAYEQVIESMDDAVMVCDAQFRIVQTNSAAAQLTGRTASGLHGQSIEPVLAEITDFKLDPRIEDAIGTRAEIVSRAAADPRYFDLRASPLRNRQGIVTGQVFVLREITDRKRVEQQALDLALERERVRLLQTFIQNASHDFRTPISVILTSAYLLDKLGERASTQITTRAALEHSADRDQPDEQLLAAAEAVTKMRGKVEAIQVSATRLEKLVESMLEVLQLERTPQFEFAPADVNSLVADCVQAYQAAAVRNKLRLEFQPDSALPPSPVDAYQLRRAVQQLIDNALHYTPPGGAVAVKTYASAAAAVIQISDTGIGIRAADLPHIFEQFYRADQARSDATGGAGLGLAIANCIVTAHQGRIEVESAEGQGSVFRIHLPLNALRP